MSQLRNIALTVHELEEGEFYWVLMEGTDHQLDDVLPYVALETAPKLYANYAIAEYWIVDSENQSVLIFRLREQSLEEVATLTGENELSSPILPGFQLKVRDIFNL